jgi:hypothetical protein
MKRMEDYKTEGHWENPKPLIDVEFVMKCSRLDSNQHVLKRTPAPQAGVSTNFTT